MATILCYHQTKIPLDVVLVWGQLESNNQSAWGIQGEAVGCVCILL